MYVLDSFRSVLSNELVDFEHSQATTKDGGDDITAFMSIFFEHFTKFKGRALHLAGESYGVGTPLPQYVN